MKAEKPFVGFGEALVPEGKIGFGKLKEMVGAGKIKLLIWFGGLHPYSYPNLFPELSLVPFRGWCYRDRANLRKWGLVKLSGEK